MIKRIKKIIHKEVQRRYSEFEESYLSIEKHLYTSLESRLDTIESKFDTLSELIKEEIKSRKSVTEQKLKEYHSKEKQEIKEAVENVITEPIEYVAEPVVPIDAQQETIEGVDIPEPIAKSTSEQIKTYPEDKLTLLKGLGGTMQHRLYEHGITSFLQLSKLRKKEVESLGKTIRGFKSRYATANWKVLAADLVKQAEEKSSSK